MSIVAACLLSCVLTASAADSETPADPAVAAAQRAVRAELLGELQIPLTAGERRQRDEQRERKLRKLDPEARPRLEPVRRSAFAETRGVFADTLAQARAVEGAAEGSFELLVHGDFFLSLAGFVETKALSRKEAKAFNLRVRSELGPALERGEAGASVSWSPAGLEKLELLLVGRQGGKTFLRRAGLLAVEVRVEPACCAEPPVPMAFLRVRVPEGLPGAPNKRGMLEVDGFLVLVASNSPASARIRKLPASKVPRIEQKPGLPIYYKDARLDLDLDGIPDVASSHDFDCIDDTCSAIYLNAGGRWRMIRFEGPERYCVESC